ncbi:helix-turn-helix domain-containing protein [Streptomyces sp. CA-181903]|uniref:helix-turn-helix domain-containing protein n=1 Tax=Streptomyces sp. CA-181903 TaxID=3240055 RepID=UPI003D94ADD7
MSAIIEVPGPGANVRLLRDERGWKQEELARRAGLSRPHIGKIERGERTLTQGVAAALARAFGVSLEVILGSTPVVGAEESLKALNSAIRRFDLPAESTASPEQLKAALAEMAEIRGKADLTQVLLKLPPLVSEVTNHAHRTGTPEAWAMVAEAYSCVYWLAARHRWMTLADLAVTKQKIAAQQADPVTLAVAARDEAGVYLNHGEFEDGLAVVDRAITQVERGDATGFERSYALGTLHLRGLTLAGRLGDKRTADRHIDSAWALAEDFDRDVCRAGGIGGIHFGPQNTAIHVVATCSDLRRHADAIAVMRDLTKDPARRPLRLPATRTSPMYMNTARSKLALGDREGALEDLENAWSIAPQMAKVHPTSQELIRVLTTLHKRSNPRLVRLARKAEIEF